jgi:hypothetical protein
MVAAEVRSARIDMETVFAYLAETDDATEAIGKEVSAS